MQTSNSAARGGCPLFLVLLGAIAFFSAWTISSLMFDVYRPIHVYPEEVLPRGDAL